nr:MAG TPA: hypothetical protein [Caudoviricetes sp.]
MPKKSTIFYNFVVQIVQKKVYTFYLFYHFV